jgi:hypothetical protein
MAPSSNPRHERFVQALFQGEPTNRALRGNERVRERLTELQQQAAKDNEISVASVCAELDEAIAVAKTKGQANAMVCGWVTRQACRVAGG